MPKFDRNSRRRRKLFAFKYTTLLRHSGSKNQNNTTKPKINEKKKNKTKNELNQ